MDLILIAAGVLLVAVIYTSYVAYKKRKTPDIEGPPMGGPLPPDLLEEGNDGHKG